MVRWDYTDLSTRAGEHASRWWDAPPAGRAQHGPGEELVGTLFRRPKELRHLAEQHFGELFVPTRVISEQPHSAVVALQHPDHGELMVHAERARHWYPYRVTRVDRPGSRG
jgi:hypothetical protein